MGKRRGIMGRLIDTRVDKWMSWDYISDTTGRLKNTVDDLITPEKPKYKETFSEAMIRLNLTEEDLQQRKKEFSRLFYFFLLISLAIIGYAVYLASNHHFGGCLISFCLACYTLSQAFKWNFWLFQIRNRKLGCSVKEWLNGTVADKSPGTDVSVTTKENKPTKRNQ